MSLDTLVLNGGSYRPISAVSWKRSITLVYQDKVNVVSRYDNWEVSSPSCDIEVPSVVVLDKHVHCEREVPFNRRNVYVRDRYECQYCGRQADSTDQTELNVYDLTFDHVVPRSKGGETRWDNIVTSCHSCNLKKSDARLDNIDMSPNQPPHKPESYNPLLFDLKGRDVPDEWNGFFQSSIQL